MRRRKENFFKSGLLIIANLASFLGLGAMSSKAVVIDHAMLESRQLKPLQSQQQSSYQGQQALLHQPPVSPLEVVCYSKSEHQLVPKNYVTHSFFGIQNAWIGKKIFFNGAQPAWPGSQKQLEKKFFLTRSYASAAKIVMGRAFATCSYPTKTFHPEARAQGGLDYNFQKALQQKKSPGEARGELGKEF